MKRRPFKQIVIALLVTLAVLIAVFLLYTGDYYRADEAAAAVMNADDSVRIEKNSDCIAFIPENPSAGFIFYPGGKVEHTAYAPLMRALAEENILCVLAEMPFNLAVFDVDAASDYSDRYPQTERWFIGGHSLGGSMAACHAAKHPGDYEGLALLAAYSTADLKDVGLDVLSVYGSEDRVLSMEKYEKYRTNLPENTVESVIEGGCHAGFGLYGPQDGDGTPSIPAEEQIQRTASLITDMIFNQ